MLSKKTKYALSALLHLAYQYEQALPVLISTIAQERKIPKKFLENILLDLKNAGILSSRKGKGGGYYLLRPPTEVNLADVIRLFDGAIALLPCVAYKYYEKCDDCPYEEGCGIRSVFQEVRDESVRILKETTLSDLLERERLLRERAHAGFIQPTDL